jgi:hypothetical protein
MKKLIVLSVLLFGTLAANAQIRFGAKAGVNLSKINIDYTTLAQTVEESSITSYHLGGYIEFKAFPKLFIQPGLELHGLGGKVGTAPDDEKANMMYLRLPLHLVTRLNLGLGSIFAGAGPYAGYALSGTSESNGIKKNINFGNAVEDDYKKTDLGLSFLAGYQLKSGLNFSIGYQMGLSNNLPDDVAQVAKAKNANFSLSLGYSFKL